MAARKPWYAQVTTWTGVIAVIAGAGGLVTGTMDSGTAIQTILGGIAVIFGRKAIEEVKGGK